MGLFSTKSRHKFQVRHGIAALIALTLLAGWLAYVKFRSASLRDFLQQVLNDNAIPVDIVSFEIDARARELLSGKIRALKISARHRPSKLVVRLETPVSYVLSPSSIHLELSPVVRSKGLPDFKGTVSADFGFTRHRARVRLGQVRGDLDLTTTEPLRATLGVAEVDAASLRVKSHIVYDPEAADGLPLETASDIFFLSPRARLPGVLLEETELAATTSLRTDGARVKGGEIRLRRPLPLVVRGDIGDGGALRAKFKFASRISPLLQRLRRLVRAPVLDRIEGDGTFAVEGSVFGTTHAPLFSAITTLAARKIEIADMLEGRSLVVQNLSLKTPVSYPPTSSVGTLDIASIGVSAIEARDLRFKLQSSPEEIAVLLAAPVAIPAFGDHIRIRSLKARVPFHPSRADKTESSLPGIPFPILVSTSVQGGPFRIDTLQRSVCLGDRKPFSGTIRFDYPKIFNSQRAIHAHGDADLDLFGGRASVGAVRYSWKEPNPLVGASVSWSDLDLHAIGEWTGFGDMRGSLDGSLENAAYSITQAGPVAVEYDFTVRGRPRSGKVVSFYGRAVDNILELLGSRKDEMPWYARAGINLSMTFRNLFPATADYMGFRAKTSEGWTELYTFDPPGEKNHYLLNGTAFKIPLNTHGIYPAIMSNESFQTWLGGMVYYFKNLMREKENAKSGEEKTIRPCVPFWEEDSDAS